MPADAPPAAAARDSVHVYVERGVIHPLMAEVYNPVSNAITRFQRFVIEATAAVDWASLIMRNPRVGLSTFLKGLSDSNRLRGCISQVSLSDPAAAAAWNTVLTMHTARQSPEAPITGPKTAASNKMPNVSRKYVRFACVARYLHLMHHPAKK